MKKKLISLLVVAAMAGTLLAGCGSSSSSSSSDSSSSSESGSATSKETLTVRIAQDPGSCNTATLTSNTPQDPVQNLVVESLTRYYDEDGETVLKYLLAEEIVLDDDQLGITVTIRDDVYFSDGENMTAEDVAYSFTDIFAGSSRALRYEWFDFENVTVVDDYTVHIPFFYYSCTYEGDLVNIGIYEKANVEANIDDEDLYTTGCVASGPYVVTEWTTNDRVVLEKNENYWDEEAIIDEVIFRVISEESVALMELQTGGIDCIFEADYSDVVDLEGDDSYSTYSKTFEQAVYLGFNMNSEALQDLAVRQAICYAIDVDVINEGAFDGGAEYPYTVFSSTGEYNLEYDEDSWPYSYDPEKAKELLEEAGATDLELTFVVESVRQNVAEQIQNMLTEIGITVNLEVVDSSIIVNTLLNEGDSFDLYIRRSGGPSSAGQAAYFVYNNNYAYSHVEDTMPEVGEALTEILGTSDDAERQELWESFQESAINDWLFSYDVAQEVNYVIYDSSLQGVSRARWTYNIEDWYFE